MILVKAEQNEVAKAIVNNKYKGTKTSKWLSCIDYQLLKYAREKQ